MGIIFRLKNVLVNPVVWVLGGSALFSFLFFLYGIDSWRFAFVGDDWPFYTFALKVVENHFRLNPFSFAGVYGKNAVLTSMYQAVFLQFLGASVVSWRFSNSVLIFPSAVLFYFFVKVYFGRLTAVFSTVLLQWSFYLANFFKIGYINPQALPWLLVCLLLAALLGLHPSKKKAVLLGLCLGVSFYIYIGPIFPLVVWPYLLPLFGKVKRKKFFGLLSLCVGSYVLLLLPLLLNIHSLLGPLQKTPLASPEHERISIPMNVLHSFFLFYKDYEGYHNHFVSGPYVDVVTAVFLTVGLVVCFVSIRKRVYMFLLLSYVCLVVLLGLTTIYPAPSVTRGFFLLPFGFLFAGIGLRFFYGLIRPRLLAVVFLVIVFVLVLRVNMYRSQVRVFRDGGYTKTALLVKSLQETEGNGKSVVFLVLSKDESYNRYLGWFQVVREGYGLTGVSFFVLRPERVSCEYVMGRELVVLETDEEAVAWVRGNVCGKRYGYEVLAPKIPYY